MTSCINCNTELNQGRNCTGKYCNNQCQQEYQSRSKREQNMAKVLLGTACSKWVKIHLIEHHGSICLSPSCAWDFTKKPLVVELEHIDGDSTNNALDNCTLLCPNCHSLTPTYKNRNFGNGRHARKQRYADGKSY